jgi:predicted trehalose synthase
MEVEASITEKLVEHTTTKLFEVAGSLLTPLKQCVCVFQKMKNAGLLRRMFEGIKKIFQGKSYKTYSVRMLEKDLRAYLTCNEKDLGSISTTVTFDAFGALVVDQVQRSFPKADQQWIDDALTAARDVVSDHWGRAQGKFFEKSKQYRDECNREISAMMAGGNANMPDKVSSKAMHYAGTFQGELAMFFDRIDLTRLTAADLCGLMEDHVLAQEMIQKSKDAMVDLIEQAKCQGDAILGEVQKLVLMTQSTVLAQGELQKIADGLKTVAEKSLRKHVGLASITGLNEQIGHAIEDAHEALNARCEQEIAHAQKWYQETEERLAHTIQKRATQSKNLTRLVQHAPLVALEAAYLTPKHPMSRQMTSLYEHCKAIVEASVVGGLTRHGLHTRHEL